MKILFIPFTLESHIISTFGFADLLKSNKFDVHYAVPNKYIEFIKKQEFKAKSLNGFSFGYGFEEQNRREFEESANPYYDELIDRATNRIYLDRRIKLLEVVNLIKPDIIIADIFCSTDFIILYPYLKKYNVRFSLFQASYSNLDTHLYPVVDTDSVPSEKNRILFNYLAKRLNFYLKTKYDYLKFLTKSDFSIIRKNFTNNSINFKYSYKKNRISKIHFPQLTYFVLLNKEMELSDNLSENYFYIGPILFKRKINFDFGLDYKSKIREIILKKNQNYKIIYLAFGTVIVKQNEKLFLEFVNKIVEILDFDNDIILVSSIGSLIDNVRVHERHYCFSKVSQIEILKICDGFITHGGTGSINEAVEFQVPMLVYNFGLVYDHIGNSKKVVFHGIGIEGDFRKDTPKSVFQKIDLLIHNPIFKANLSLLSKKIKMNESYGENNIISKVKNLKYIE